MGGMAGRTTNKQTINEYDEWKYEKQSEKSQSKSVSEWVYKII